MMMSLVSAHTASARRIRSSIHHFWIYSTFVLVSAVLSPAAKSKGTDAVVLVHCRAEPSVMTLRPSASRPCTAVTY